MKREIRKVAVLGAGVMGSGIAAHLANVGIPVLMLDIVPPKFTEADEKAGLTPEDPRFRNKFALKGLEGIKKSKPALLYSKRFLDLISVGNFEDDWEKLAECDWIVEVVVERLDIKQQVFERVEKVRKPGAIVSSNTSGLSINAMAEGRSEDFRKHFLVTHFFNPVRYMKLLELVPNTDTLPEVLEFMADFGRFRLGKGIVYGKDTPNFVGNRIGVYGIVATMRAMVEMDYQVDEVDAITGPAMGRPKSAAFGTVDLVGLDVLAHVVRTLDEGCPDDEEHDLFTVPDFVQRMIEAGALGRKAKAGFYKREKQPDGKKVTLVIDWKTGEYRPKEKYRYPSLGKARNIHDVRERVKTVVFADDRAGAFAWRITRDTLAYTSRRFGEIADTIVDIDNALKWGFNWELGPFETWDALGVRAVAEKMQAEGVEPAAWVLEMLEAGAESFYVEDADGRKYWDPASKSYVREPRPASFLVLSDIKKREKAVVYENAGASLVDIGDGIACVEFHSDLQPKLNPIDDKIQDVMEKALEIGPEQFRGLVIHHQGENFSAGANLLMILEAIQTQQWGAIDEMVRRFQGVTTGLRKAPIPVVTAPFGFAFGGGCEITMGGDRVCAAAETYIGLVEVGVGLIPAGGGCLFMLERMLEYNAATKTVLSNLPFIQKAFENIGMAKVATSGEEARDLGILRPWDKVVVNRDEQLHVAKQMAIGMAEEGYRPPQPKTFYLPGKEGVATIKMMLHNMKLTHWVSSYDTVVGTHLANILCGGDTTIHEPVTEQQILDLEREAFLSLCGEPKTQDRIKYMLANNKPLRN